MIIGIAGLIIWPFVFGTMALIFGSIGLAKNEEKYATAAVILGFVDLAWTFIVLMLGLTFF